MVPIARRFYIVRPLQGPLQGTSTAPLSMSMLSLDALPSYHLSLSPWLSKSVLHTMDRYGGVSLSLTDPTARWLPVKPTPGILAYFTKNFYNVLELFGRISIYPSRRISLYAWLRRMTGKLNSKIFLLVGVMPLHKIAQHGKITVLVRRPLLEQPTMLAIKVQYGKSLKQVPCTSVTCLDVDLREGFKYGEAERDEVSHALPKKACDLLSNVSDVISEPVLIGASLPLF